MRWFMPLACLLVVMPVVAGGLGDYLPAQVAYDPSVPKPADVLGFEVGEWHARHDMLVRYMEVLAAASPRVALMETGRTHEGRRLLLVAFSSPENIERLDDLRSQHLREGETGQRNDGPLVVWQGFSVHGNEASGSNASMLLAYHLAAGRGEVEALLADTVVLIDPAVNPDGLGRFAAWANGHRGMNAAADPNDREHNEAWPNGRTNHYWFDLNRDWLTLTHPESRARVAMFHRWRPHVLTDFHEMGSDSTYFFQPGVPDRRHPLTPERNQELTAAIARYHARAMDGAGRLYYTEETFDDFYFGKGSSYPDINGSVGILFEQASSRGHRMQTIHGELDFPTAIGNQLRTALSTLEAADALRDDLRDWQAGFWGDALRDAAQDAARGYVIADGGDPARALAFVDILLRHGIEVRALAAGVEVAGRRFVPGQAWVVPLRQRQYRLVKAMMEYRTTFEDETFYDISAWTLPAAFDLPFAELGRSFRESLLGDTVSTALLPPGAFTPRPDAVAYAFEWTGYYAPRALQRLIAGGFLAYATTEPIVVATDVGEVALGRGAILVPVGVQARKSRSAPGTSAAARPADDRRAELEEVLRLVAEADGIAVRALTTGLTPGGVDMGSPMVRPLEEVRLLLVVGDGVRAYEAGEVWHLLDTRVDLPISLVDTDRLQRVDLRDYTHIVLVGGDYKKWSEAWTPRLRSWIKAGGVLVATTGAVEWVTQQGLHVGDDEAEGGQSPAPPKTEGARDTGGKKGAPGEPEKGGEVRDGGAGKDEQAAGADLPASGSHTVPAAEERFRPYAEFRDDRAKRLVSGAIFGALLDGTHPLGYGYVESDLAVFRSGTHVLEPSKNAYENVARYASAPLVAGYASPERQEEIAGTAAIVASRVGGGVVIRMADNPNFRGVWYGTNKLFLNALFFGRLIDETKLEENGDRSIFSEK